MYYEREIRALNKSRLKYLIIGGLAVNLYGVPRATQDLDLIVQLEKNNLKKLIKTLKQLGYQPRLPVKAEDLLDETKREKWIKEKNLVGFTFYSLKANYQEIDILIKPLIDFNRAHKNKKVIKAGGLKIYLVSLSDLIRLKKIGGRAHDLADVTMLNKIKKLEKRR